MAQALSEMDLGNWIPQPDTEASEKSQRVARTTAVSRRCPIMDSVDYSKSIEDQAREESAMIDSGSISGVHRSSAGTEGSGVAMVGTGSSTGLGQTDTRDWAVV
jgi:hypothetical protein